MAATFVLKLGTLDLSSFLRVNPDDKMDPLGAPWIEPAFTETPFADGQPLISTTVHNREQMLPLYIKDSTRLKDALHVLIRSINNAGSQRPLTLEWRDDGATASTFFDVQFVRFEPDFNFRRSQYGIAAGILHVWTSGYGHTGTTRVTATAAGTGIFLSVPIGSVAGDAPALLDTTIVSGAVLPTVGRIVALAPIINPSYTPQILAASLTDLQAGATLVGASGADGSQYLALPVSPTGGASGIACKVPLPNPTIAGGDNRILAVVKSGINVGVAITAQDPYGNPMGGTAVASMTGGWGLVDLGVCRLPTTGLPTLPKIAITAGAIWSSGAAGPGILASPAGLAINEILCLPDKNLSLVLETTGGRVLSKDGFTLSNVLVVGQSDNLGNAWTMSWNNGGIASPPQQLVEYDIGVAAISAIGGSIVSGAHLAGIVRNDMVISGKPWFQTGGAVPAGQMYLFKESASGVFTQGRLGKTASNAWLDLAVATSTTLNTIASLALATVTQDRQYRMALQFSGQGAFITFSKDDGGPVFIPGSAAFASLGVASNAAIGGGGMPGFAISQPSGLNGPFLSSWEVDALLSSGNLQAWDSYRFDGPNADTYRVASGGVFAGQKLVGVQRGAFPKMQPSTTSLAVVVAPFDQGTANDVVSAAISIRERFTYGR